MVTETDYHYTGYMGGLKGETWDDIMAKDPALLLRRAFIVCCPNNCRDKMIKTS